MSKADRNRAGRGASAPSGHPPAGELARYIDALRGERPEELPDGLVAHVEDCPHCQAQIMDVYFFLSQMPPAADSPAQVKPAPVGRRWQWLYPLGGIAAAAAVFVLLLTDVISIPRRAAPERRFAAPGTIPGVRRQATVPKPVVPSGEGAGQAPAAHGGSGGPDGRSAEFALNPNLESMVGSRTRGLVITVFSPPNHVTLAEEIRFAWREFTREPLSLVIVNNRNETIWRSEVEGNSARLRSPLSPGCYYWKLESASELYYVGKFFVSSRFRSPGE